MFMHNPTNPHPLAASVPVQLTSPSLCSQVFIPREDLSLDVIKQYRVVRPQKPSAYICPLP